MFCSARAGYYGHMSHIDHQINRFLEVLRELLLLDNTFICFVSDHGESAWSASSPAGKKGSSTARS